MNKKEIEDLLNTIEDNVPIEEYRSEGASDRLTHYELDQDSWQYSTLEYIRSLQQRIDKAIEFINHEYFKREQIGVTDCNDFQKWEIDEILSILKGENNE